MPKGKKESFCQKTKDGNSEFLTFVVDENENCRLVKKCKKFYRNEE